MARNISKYLELLPDRIYLFIYPKLLSIVNKNRKPLTVNFSKSKKDVYLAQDKVYGALYFYEKIRMELYCWPNGVSKRIDSVKEKYEYANVRVRLGDTVVDVGANIGEFSIAISQLAKNIYAFEPDPVPFNCLKTNTENKSNIHSNKIALSDRSEDLTFYFAPKTADSSIVEPDVPYDKKIIKAITLDDFFINNERVDFLKIEAEGWEPEVLRGAKRLLTTTVRDVAVDAGPERKGQNTIDEVTKILQSHSFNVIVSGNMVFANKVIVNNKL